MKEDNDFSCSSRWVLGNSRDYKLELLDEIPEKMRTFTVKALDRGFTVKVGCKKFSIGDKNELIALLTDYINDHKAVEEAYHKGELF